MATDLVSYDYSQLVLIISMFHTPHQLQRPFRTAGLSSCDMPLPGPPCRGTAACLLSLALDKPLPG